MDSGSTTQGTPVSDTGKVASEKGGAGCRGGAATYSPMVWLLHIFWTFVSLLHFSVLVVMFQITMDAKCVVLV